MKFLRVVLLVVLITLSNVISQEDDEFETMVVELQMTDYDLSDAYDEVSDATKNALLGHGFDDKVFVERERANLMRKESAKNREFEADLPYDLIRNWTLLTNTGDMLLPQAAYDSLIAFHNTNEALSNQANLPCLHSNSSGCTISKQDFMDVLATNRNSSDLNETWTAWQEMFLINKPQFNSTLQLVNEAFIPNEQHNAMSYWEMLSEYHEGYAQAQTLWEQVQPLYKKLHDFVRVRIYKHYNITQNDTAMPVYLLGSNFGTDWSNIADIVLPHPYLYDEVLTELKYHTTKDVYKLAENATKTMGLGPLGKKFWAKSNFNFSSCGPHIFSDCSQHYTEILTCKKLGWTEYLDIHEASINVALRNQDYASLPRRDTRFSAVDEALQGIGSLIAINNLPVYEFIPQTAFKEEKDTYDRKNTALLLTALRVLPKLPYYLLADTWRLEELDFSYGNFTEKWWQKRNEMQGVRGNTNLETDFLTDSFITSNKPHLSKFFGAFLQFQILDYYQKFYSSENGTIASFIGSDQNFKTFINDRPNRNWLDLISFHYGMEVSSTAILEYFKPLEDYLDNAPLKQVTFSTTLKPRTTKTTPKPTPRKPKGSKKNQSADLTVANKTLAVQNDQNQKEKEVKKLSDAKVSVDSSTEGVATTSASSEKLYVLTGIAGFVCVAVLIVIVVRRLKKKRRTNNRRFET